MSDTAPRRRTTTKRNFYEGVLDRATKAELLAAGRAEGLDDEIALLRILVRRELAANPDDSKLVFQGITLLVRAVTARYRLSPADASALTDHMIANLQSFDTLVWGTAGAHGLRAAGEDQEQAPSGDTDGDADDKGETADAA